MRGKRSVATGGVSGIELLQVVFVVLKLTKVIDWSWWWVLAPTWISIAFAAVLLLLYYFYIRETKRANG